MKFSANLGFLWTERALPDAIHAAKGAGFDAVECHWPYDFSAKDVATALQETGLSMLGLNTSRGNVAKGENGLCALVGREADARKSIDQAINYAVAIGAANVHAMSGFAEGAEAHSAFVRNLAYACNQAKKQGITILIEPLNGYDAPGYFLNSTTQAMQIVEEVGQDNLKLMFDCYHVQLIEGDVGNKLRRLKDQIGHIQFASVPDRGPPDHGELDYRHVFAAIADMGWTAPLGAEYKPIGKTEHSLGWLDTFSKGS